MRVQGPNAAAVATTPAKARRSSAAGGFALPAEETTPSTTGPTGLRSVGGIDALIALQSGEEPTGRRRRAVARGRVALDALDELKHGLLAGTLQPAVLQQLKTVATELKGDDSGVPGLDAVLREIELRVEVEIAKLAARPEAPASAGL